MDERIILMSTETLEITRKDLTKEALTFDEIKYYHIAGSLEPYKKAKRVVFTDGKMKILKDRNIK